MAASMTLRTFLSKYLYLTRRPCALCLRGQCTSARRSYDREIVIPKKVKRDSLTILKALAGTVRKDPTRPSYTLLDDPQFTSKVSLSPVQKKKMSLAKDSGRKTARYMAHLYRDAFEHDTAQPRVKAFDLDPLYKCTTLGEVALKERIELRRVAHAVEIYKKMEAQDMEVSEPVLLSLLELLCVYSESDPPETRYQEENLYKSELEDTKHVKWVNNGVAEKLFGKLHETNGKCYNWILKGYCKFGEAKKAFDLYEEVKTVEMKVDLSGYHGLLHQSGAGKASSEEVFDTIKDLWQAMKEVEYPASLEMFNCSLQALPAGTSRNHATDILAEMTAVGIAPDSTTLGQVLRCSYRLVSWEDKGPDDMKVTLDHLYIVNDMMNYIKGNSVDMNNYNADMFFVYAMDICKTVGSSKLALQVFELLETKTLQEIFTQPSQAFNFYNNFLEVLIHKEDLDTVMTIHEKTVPNLFLPKPFLRRYILSKIRLWKSYHYLPMIWPDYMYGETFCTEMCDIMANAKCSQELKEEFFLLVDVAFNKMWISKASTQYGDTMSKWITGPVIGFGIQIAINVDRLDIAAKYLKVYHSMQSRIRNPVSDMVMDELVDAFVEKQTFFYAEELMETITAWSDIASDDPAMLLRNKRDRLENVLPKHQLEQIFKK